MRTALLNMLVILVALTGCASPTTTTPPTTAPAPSADATASKQDPLPSWNDTPARANIVDFVTRVTTAGGPDFVPPNARIAVFDNDGTLWAEAPVPFQLAFVLDEVKRRAATDPVLAADPVVQSA